MVLVALVMMVAKARRRYGGYIVHVGIVLMYIGFTGSAYDQEREASLLPGQSTELAGYSFRYDGVRVESDPNKRMIFADLTVSRDGTEIGQWSPAKYIYRTHPEMPTTEVAIRTTPSQDLYMILATVDQETDRATFRILVHPLVMWIWLGAGLLLIGVFIAGFPKLSEILAPASAPSPARVGAAVGLVLAITLGGALVIPHSAHAQADGTSSLHAGTVEIHDPAERRLFGRLLCECGDCQRLPLDSCGCGWAEGMRAELRARVARGEEANALIADYRERFGPQAISVPADEGLDRALWAVPVVAIVLAALGLVFRARRWARTGSEQTDASLDAPAKEAAAYDARLEDELRRLEGE
jgi:cytochrome c-type biogenesis protein CcmF